MEIEEAGVESEEARVESEEAGVGSEEAGVESEEARVEMVGCLTPRPWERHAPLPPTAWPVKSGSPLTRAWCNFGNSTTNPQQGRDEKQVPDEGHGAVTGQGPTRRAG